MIFRKFDVFSLFSHIICKCCKSIKRIHYFLCICLEKFWMSFDSGKHQYWFVKYLFDLRRQQYWYVSNSLYTASKDSYKIVFFFEYHTLMFLRLVLESRPKVSYLELSMSTLFLTRRTIPITRGALYSHSMVFTHEEGTDL